MHPAGVGASAATRPYAQFGLLSGYPQGLNTLQLVMLPSSTPMSHKDLRDGRFTCSIIESMFRVGFRTVVVVRPRAIIIPHPERGGVEDCGYAYV